jgi:hypothetical protein
MRALIQVAFGLVLAAIGTVASIYLGLLLNRPPTFRTGAEVLLIIAVTQVISVFSFRRRIAFQVAFGVVVCMGISFGFLYSPLPMFWEQEDQPHVYSITWRSAIAFLLLLLITQGVAHLTFRVVRRLRRNPHCEPAGRLGMLGK